VQNLRDWLLAKYEQPRDMPAIHRPHLENSPLLPRISRCLEKVTALENTGFDVGILEWSSHRSMSAAEAVSSPKVDQEPEVLKAHSGVLGVAVLIGTLGCLYIVISNLPSAISVVGSLARPSWTQRARELLFGDRSPRRG
jgi:hypothetical protein